jgi:hypothetical protein
MLAQDLNSSQEITQNDHLIDQPYLDRINLSTSIFSKGMANTKHTKYRKYHSSKVYEFVQAWIEHGEKSFKIPADQAADMMKLYGTKLGQERFPEVDFMQSHALNMDEDTGIDYPRFSLLEMLDSFQLRSYASKPSKYFVDLIINAYEREQEDDTSDYDEESDLEDND